MARIPIFKPGRHYPALTADELARTVDAYDPAKHEAPLVLGHPADDAPAHGWVQSLQLSEDGLLVAEPKDVSAALLSGFEAGRYRKVSASFYLPTAGVNPTPGVYALRHVGFLGAAVPAVSGLPPATFAEGETADDFVTVDFYEAASPWTWRSLASLLRGMRDWIIEEKSLEVADTVLPSWEIDQIGQEADRIQNADRVDDDARFSQPTPEGDRTMPPNDNETAADRAAALDAREEALAAREAALAADAEAAARRGALEFAEKLCGEGRVLPRDRDAVAGLVASVPADATVQFAADDGGATPAEKPMGEWLRSFLESLPVQVDFSERAPADTDPHRDAARVDKGFRAPADAAVGGNAELHRKVLDFAAREGVDYDTALTRVAGG